MFVFVEMVENKKYYIYMNGCEVFKFVVCVMGIVMDEVLCKVGLECMDVDLFVFY